LKNTRLLEVANFVSRDEKNSTMDFEKMSGNNLGAEYLTLIKGDIDNLGLIMAYGLDRDRADGENNYAGISRITTLSNNLKYFFSFFLNGFMKSKTVKYNNGNVSEDKKDNLVYTIFAGGDDLMLVCPQSYALALLRDFNDIFNDFVCLNKEIHISYSITHFKHSSPIRLVAEFSEENQQKSKENGLKYIDIENLVQTENECFCEDKNKSSTFIFNSVIKNSEYELLMKTIDNLVKWSQKAEDGKEYLSSGMLRNLLAVSELLKGFREEKDTSKLMWHPLLTYSINRNLKNKNGKYKCPEVDYEKFFKTVLSISKQDEESQKLENILYPAICGAIYILRN